MKLFLEEAREFIGGTEKATGQQCLLIHRCFKAG